MASGILGKLSLRVIFIVLILVVAIHYLLTPFLSQSFQAGSDENPRVKLKLHPGGGDSEAPEYDWSSFTPYNPPPYTARRAKACFVILVRNDDLHSMRATLRQLEDRFNHKYNYPYVFLNNEEFTDHFKELTTSITSGNTSYGLIPKEHWSFPSWISEQKAADTRVKMKDIIYGSSESYRHMCRFESGFFFRHPLMDEYEYYWRVEPDVNFFCDLQYDPFLMMQERQLKYGFTISLFEYRDTIPTLWETTKRFMEQRPELIAENNLMGWVNGTDGDYNLCHFWSNFEIASLSWLRSKQYMEYFDYLDKAGGFFYERWGDAPVHSLAVAMFLKKEEVHWFEDVGYYHGPFYNCPNSKALNKFCHCNPKDSLHLSEHSCTNQFLALPNSS
ncbi:hypothetical protein H4R33_003363 [Dimargaris cristalligena]|uniref:Glycolipid 2-alpha-mannosyltransferase-domain-containing protein n=1 Tax=Dimargaris cristalligena TaxID=215637 RepID=A0A4P9ZXS3_9FUNG|nr:hypothetical protein H4R33_003363 [Dimargaris cristalligena]RKP38463.1 glycolipid 2-alpha-mannosyltransferase-domain-containing protein [Dimargaris cristalligena]|eukprot:RKP38463.1 glycolipid 2-alpha-mannosyltransferase-domain-containing protein [Dimargaris cristalligena]